MKNDKVFIIGLFFIVIIAVIYFLFKGEESNVKIREVKGELFIPADSLGFVKKMEVKNGYLFILDKQPIKNDYMVKVYDTRDGKLINEFGRFGSGPGEMMGPRTIENSRINEKCINIFDFMHERFYVFDVSDIKNIKLKKTYKLIEGICYSPSLINETTIVSLGYTIMGGRYSYLDTTGKIRKYAGEILPGKKPETPMPVHQHAMLGALGTSLDVSKIVITTQLSDYIDIYNKEGKLIKRIVGPYGGYPPKYKVGKLNNGDPTMIIDASKAKMGYTDIAFGDEKFYTIFVNKPDDGDNQLAGKEIHVYDMNGTLQEKIILDHELSNMCYDEKTKTLYGKTLQPASTIYKFKL